MGWFLLEQSPRRRRFERIVPGGHGVIDNAEAIDEVIQVSIGVLAEESAKMTTISPDRAAWDKVAFPPNNDEMYTAEVKTVTTANQEVANSANSDMVECL